ncbi:hypothetical protein LCL95_08720 [Bacillus timonensis]|nr:hypothetical protein [Bacillus timonensis]
MGDLHIGLLIYLNIVVTVLLYFFIFKRRKLIGFQLGMNISMIVGGMVTLSIGILLIEQFPYHFTVITMVSTLVGMIIGGFFGAMFDYQTFLTGYINGLLMGIMSPMLGAVIENTLLFVVFIEVVLIFSILLVVASSKSS